MTKKDYVLLSNVIRQEVNFIKEGSNSVENDLLVIESLVNSLSVALLKNNPKFRIDLFKEACGL